MLLALLVLLVLLLLVLLVLLLLLLLLVLLLLRLWLLLLLLLLVLKMAFKESRVGDQHCLDPVKALFQLTSDSGTKTGFFLLPINTLLAWRRKLDCQ